MAAPQAQPVLFHCVGSHLSMGSCHWLFGASDVKQG